MDNKWFPLLLRVSKLLISAVLQLPFSECGPHTIKLVWYISVATGVNVTVRKSYESIQCGL